MFAELLSGFREARALIEQSGLSFEDGFDEMFGIYENEVLVATGARAGYVLKMLAVDSAWQGGPLLGEIINSLMNRGRAAGHESFFIYTKPDYATTFAALNFRLLASQGKVVLLEYGQGLANWLQTYQPLLRPGRNAAVVMNCNPFTNGHRYLVETAASEVDHLYLFVVREDRSVFPFEVRSRLVEEGVRDLGNVHVLDSSRYIVSNATFPTYFLKRDDPVARIQAELDATLFGTQIAPFFGITRRYVGSEPGCPLTASYNAAMQRILPPLGVEVREIARKTASTGVISASRVRELFVQGNWAALAEYVPPTTLDFLRSEAAAPILASLNNQGGKP